MPRTILTISHHILRQTGYRHDHVHPAIVGPFVFASDCNKKANIGDEFVDILYVVVQKLCHLLT